MKVWQVLVWGVLFFFLSGCSKNEIPQGEEVPVARNATALSTQGEPAFTVPEGWIQEQPSSAMRKAQFRLPGAEGAGDAELAIFTGIGGSAQQNLERWISQFKGPDGSPPVSSAITSTREISGYKVTFLDVSGSFNAGMMGAMGGGDAPAKPDYRLLGAVIEGAGAPFFLKLTGPQATVAHWKDSFESYVSSVK